MAGDPYKELGVSRGASADEVKKAFRKLAKELHPDKNPGNDAALERFKRVTSAFDVLGDAEKRAKYDAGQIDADGREQYRAPPGAGRTGGFGGFSGSAGAGGRVVGRRSTTSIWKRSLDVSEAAGRGPVGAAHSVAVRMSARRWRSVWRTRLAATRAASSSPTGGRWM